MTWCWRAGMIARNPDRPSLTSCTRWRRSWTDLTILVHSPERSIITSTSIWAWTLRSPRHRRTARETKDRESWVPVQVTLYCLGAILYHRPGILNPEAWILNCWWPNVIHSNDGKVRVKLLQRHNGSDNVHVHPDLELNHQGSSRQLCHHRLIKGILLTSRPAWHLKKNLWGYRELLET